MNEITLLRGAAPEAPPLSPAARSSARAALLEEIGASGTVRSRVRARLPRRRSALRLGAATVAVAAACTAAVVLPSDPAAPGQPGPSVTAPPAPGGIALVAAEVVTFPVSLVPVPDGLAPLYSRRGGIAAYGSTPPFYVADYEPAALVSGSPADPASGDPGRVLLGVYPEDPRSSADYGFPAQGEPTGTASVGGVEAAVWREAGSRTLLWERADGQWVSLLGEGAQAGAESLLAVAGSIVDGPRPVGLQFGLAPAGWSVGGYEESRSLDLVSDVDPALLLRLSAMGAQYTGTIDDLLEGSPAAAAVEAVTVQGRPGRLASGAGGSDGPASWTLLGQFPDGRFFRLLAPPELTREQVLQIGEQVTSIP